MSGRPRQGVGVLVLRAWTEPEQQTSFRARLTWRLDIDTDEVETIVVATRDPAVAAIAAWLACFTDANGAEGG